MKLNIRYRLIQILEIALWLGAAAGIGAMARRAYVLRDQGWRAMFDLAAPGLLAIGAGMAALLLLIGIYHNTRRNGDALEHLARQGAGTMRRLPGAARDDAPPANPAANNPAPVAAIAPVAVPAAPPPPMPASAPAASAPTEPALSTAPAETGNADRPSFGPAPILRGSSRRLGPAS
ncbi:MAG: hypothetical protein ACK5LJ_13850 [Paracoccus sp. (in: a-proteobacteria)]